MNVEHGHLPFFAQPAWWLPVNSRSIQAFSVGAPLIGRTNQAKRRQTVMTGVW